MADLPKPEKRRSLSRHQREDVAHWQEWLCNICKVDLIGIHFDIDHIQRLDALGSNDRSNLQAICVPSHKRKTKVDNFEAKKGARIRGETCNGPKRKIQQPVNFAWPSRKMESRGWK